MPQLEELLVQVEDHWGIEDAVYRFYHHSYKLYQFQVFTEEMVKEFRALLPDRPLNRWFSEIIAEGTGHDFGKSEQKDSSGESRNILEALFHAHYFLKMICKYG